MARSYCERGAPHLAGPAWRIDSSFFISHAVVEGSERQRLLLGGQRLRRPSAAQRSDQRYRCLHLAGLQLYLGGLLGERGYLCDGNAQVVVESVLVQRRGDAQGLRGLIACLALLRHL